MKYERCSFLPLPSPTPCADISTPGGGAPNGERDSVPSSSVAGMLEMDDKAMLT